MAFSHSLEHFYLEKVSKSRENVTFFKKSRQKIWWNKKIVVPLHSLKRNNLYEQANMVDVVQLVRASDCGSECRGFESHLPPKKSPASRKILRGFLFLNSSPRRTSLLYSSSEGFYAFGLTGRTLPLAGYPGRCPGLGASGLSARDHTA